MSDKKPMVLVFAGPNGSGKSTISEYLEIVGTYTNADAALNLANNTLYYRDGYNYPKQ